jgi:N-acetylneuraminate synthase
VTSCFVIAEAGVNHNGDMDLAHRLIDAAADAGADAVKFQTFRADKLATAVAPKAGYQTVTTGAGSQFEMLRALELRPEHHPALIAHCRDRGILFASTGFDEDSVDVLDGFDVPFFKIPSGEITNFPLLRHIAAKGRPVILSTGMSTLEEVRRAVGWLSDGPRAAHGLAALSVLHCVTAYPAPVEATNLTCMATMAEALGIPVGFSDHSLGIAMPIAAAALGATIIEKHLTLDCGLQGPDHAASLEPAAFAEMVRSIQDVAKALGDGVKRPAACEAANIPVVRKSIFAARPIAKGTRFTAEDLVTKRPATGLSPAHWPDVVGQVAPRDFLPDEAIEL